MLFKQRSMAAFVILLLLLCGLSACSQKTPTWQEQYDLGVRYLSEGNYEEAIIAFSAAIEIDPKRVEAYCGLADTYLAMGEIDKAKEIWQNPPQEFDEASLALFISGAEQYEKIMEFWESGEDGIRITSLSFDREDYLAGEETLFSITVIYRCPEEEICYIRTEANSKNPDSWTRIGEDVQLSGSGARRFTVSVTPAQWDGKYFGMGFSLWTDQWDWIERDTWYITPEGDLSDHYARRNAYGATEFTCRRDYREYETLDVAQRQLFERAAAAVIAGDRNALLDVVRTIEQYEQFYTIWEGYKGKLNISPDTVRDGSQWYSMELTLRAENGTGYYCSVHDSILVDPTQVTEESWMDYYQTVDLVTCPCVDWQWNGTLQKSTWNHYFWRHQDGDTCLATEETIENGAMVDNLRDGSYTLMSHEVADWMPWEDTDETTTTTLCYRGGILVEQDGKPWTGGNGYHFINDSLSGGALYSSEQDLLDEMYW